MAFDYRPLHSGEEPRVFALIDHALGGNGDIPWEPFVERIGAKNLRCLDHEGQLVGGLGIYRMGQWFGGRTVGCGGVSVVGMTPEVRGQGGAKWALTEMLRELYADGTPIASLYPSTQRLYRSIGFEQAGSYCRYELPLSSIGVVDRELSVTRIDDPVPEPFEQVAAKRGRMTNGNLARTPGLWQRMLRFRDKPTYTAIIGDADDPEGFVCYFNEDHDEQMRLQVTDMAALTPQAVRRLWTLLADHCSIFETVRWTGPPTEPLLTFVEDCKWLPVRHFPWMLRIVNVTAALEARGYPEDVEGELHLDVIDELLPENTGRYVLSVADGKGHVTPGGTGSLRMGIKGLAPLYSGYLSPDGLARAGWLTGDEQSLRTTTRLFTGPQPWMPEIF